VTSQSTTSPRKVSAWLDLPLLRRELVESAKRRRLWIVRGCLAAAQTLFVIFNYDDLMGLPGGLGAFGGGQEIAAVINVCNMVAIYLLLPLTACAGDCIGARATDVAAAADFANLAGQTGV
jgi:hypothetical protein